MLQMLQVLPLGDALYDEPLKPSPSNYVQELQDLDAGIIPGALREIFAQTLKMELSPGAKVTDQYRYSWLIADKGSAYLVAAAEIDKQAGYRLRIFKAELGLDFERSHRGHYRSRCGPILLRQHEPDFSDEPCLSGSQAAVPRIHDYLSPGFLRDAGIRSVGK